MKINPFDKQIKIHPIPLHTTKGAGLMCPHGNPSGVCPLCMGMGGGGGGSRKLTPREMGLLTWADLLPAWCYMLAAKQRNENNAIHEILLRIKTLIENQRLLQLINKFFETQVLSKLTSFLNFINTNLIVSLARPLSTILAKANAIVAKSGSQILQQVHKAMDLTSKTINFIKEQLKNSMQMLKLAAENFISDLKEKEKTLTDMLSKSIKKTKNFLSFFLSSEGDLLNHSERPERVEQSEHSWLSRLLTLRSVFQIFNPPRNDKMFKKPSKEFKP